MAYQEDGITLREIFSILHKQGKRILLVSALLFVVGTVILQFWYNPSQKTYTLQFNILNSAIEETKYPDGTAFRYNDVLSEENLKTIIGQSDIFKNIDYREMIKSDDIYFSQYIPDEDDIVQKTYYCLTVKAKYFKNKEQAKEFMTAVISYPVTKAMEILKNINFKTNLYAFDTCKTTYSEKTSYLSAQKTYLELIYTNLIEKYGAYYTVTDDSLPENYRGMSLEQLLTSLNNVYSTQDSSYVSSAVSANYYVLDTTSYDFTGRSVARIQTLLQEKKNNENAIEQLRGELATVLAEVGAGFTTEVLAEQDISSFLSNIASLVMKNNAIDRSVADVWNQILRMGEQTTREAKNFLLGDGDETGDTLYRQVVEIMKDYDIKGKQTVSKEDLDTLLNEYRDALSDATDIAREVKIFVTEKETAIEYKSYRPEEEGGVNLWTGLTVLFFVSIIVSSILFCLVERKKQREKSEKA